jgi:uncharacterized membrane protein YoaK (UPF0700 family)
VMTGNMILLAASVGTRDRPLAVRSLLALSLFMAGWWATGGHPSSPIQELLLAIDALALGIQSARSCGCDFQGSRLRK